MDNLILKSGTKNKLKYYNTKNRENMGKLASDFIAEEINKLLKMKSDIRIVFASAPSQTEMLKKLVNDDRVDWERITAFHMDEYVGLSNESSKSFKHYIVENIYKRVDLGQLHLINSESPAQQEMERYSQLLKEKPIDIVCLGVGDNGHIAFNDPHVADFNDPDVIKIVNLDEVSRNQQVNDGIFEKIDDVPSTALTLTIPTLMSAGALYCSVPGKNKARAINTLLNGDISESCPASILRTHEKAFLFMDKEAFSGVHDG